MTEKSFQGFLANHASIITKRVLELEYDIRAFSQLYPDVFEFICGYRDVIAKKLVDEATISNNSIQNLRLVDAVFDYIQWDDFNFPLKCLLDYEVEIDSFVELVEYIFNDFFEVLKRKADTNFAKNYVMAIESYRFADISDGNDLYNVMGVYLRAYSRFNDNEILYPDHVIKKEILELCNSFNPFRTPKQRAVRGSYKVDFLSSIDDKDYIALALNAFDSAEDLPVEITSFLVDYKNLKVANYIKYQFHDDFDQKKARKDIVFIQKLIDDLDVIYNLNSGFKKQISIVPNLLGLLHWDLYNENKITGNRKVVEIQEYVIKIYSDMCIENNIIMEDLSRDAVKKQLNHTRAKIDGRVAVQNAKYRLESIDPYTDTEGRQ